MLTLLPPRGTKRLILKKLLFLCFFLFLASGLAVAQETLSVFEKKQGQVNEDRPVGSLVFTDWIKEMPIPQDSIKKVKVIKEKVPVLDRKGREVKDRKGRVKTKTKRRKVVTWELRTPSEPPKFVPIQCKLGSVWVKRADLARFKQASMDLSGEYASSTGSVVLKKSPTNPRYFTFTIQNGPVSGRAELEASNVELRESNGRARLSYSEEGCTVDIAVVDRKVKVAQRGCSDYNVGNYKLEGEYNTYKGNRRVVETFNMPEKTFKYKEYLWCGSGFDSCEEAEDENGAVYITWSKGGNGFIERKVGEDVHTYRPFEHVIPHKRDFYKGEKPIAIKTKRTDMAGEWMIWYYYPKAERLKMVRAGMREDIAYMEIYE